MVLEAFKPSTEMTTLIREIREHLPVVLLTDQTNWLYDLDERDGLLNEFDETVNSFEEGYSKREPEIFRITCQRLGMIPEDLIFFDDNPDNVRRSNDFGIEAYVFNGPANSRDILVGAGVLESKDEKGDNLKPPQ
jgi:putative hydrolase of the HAD superfamily